MNIVQSADRALKFFDRILKYFCGALMLFIVLLVSASVLFRYFFNIPLAWSVEVSEYLMVYITFLTIAWALDIDGHVKIEALLNQMKPKVKKAITISSLFIVGVVFLIIFWFSLIAVIDLYQRNVVTLQILEVPRFITFAPICIGSLLFAVRSFLKIFDESILLKKEIKREEMS